MSKNTKVIVIMLVGLLTLLTTGQMVYASSGKYNIKTIIKYKSSDNKEFEDFQEYKKHQNKLNFYEELHSKTDEVKRYEVFPTELYNSLNVYCEALEFGNMTLSTLLDLLNRKKLTIKIVSENEINPMDEELENLLGKNIQRTNNTAGNRVHIDRTYVNSTWRLFALSKNQMCIGNKDKLVILDREQWDDGNWEAVKEEKPNKVKVYIDRP